MFEKVISFMLALLTGALLILMRMPLYAALAVAAVIQAGLWIHLDLEKVRNG